MRRALALIAALTLLLGGCAAGEPAAPSAAPSAATSTEPAVTTTHEEDTEMVKINVEVNGRVFTATLESNAAAHAFAEMLPLTVAMNDYAGFEKVGSLGTRLPASNSQMTTAAGDIVLYNSNQIVVFYGSNSWSYTRLARIDDLNGWSAALGSGLVDITFSLA